MVFNTGILKGQKTISIAPSFSNEIDSMGFNTAEKVTICRFLINESRQGYKILGIDTAVYISNYIELTHMDKKYNVKYDSIFVIDSIWEEYQNDEIKDSAGKFAGFHLYSSQVNKK